MFSSLLYTNVFLEIHVKCRGSKYFRNLIFTEFKVVDHLLTKITLYGYVIW